MLRKIKVTWIREAFEKYWKDNVSNIPFPWHWEFEWLNYTDIYYLKRFAKVYGYKTAREIWEAMQRVGK